ncbi:MAG: glutamine synthetase [Rhizobiaceae bacterium]|nr:glutamine synthetase [Rhizobiaceae bacterium]
MAAASELKAFLKANPGTTHCDAILFDLCGNAYGKRLPRAHLERFFDGGSPICAAMSLVDVQGNTADPMGHGFSDGDPDANIRPVPGTLVPVPWNPGLAQVVCEPANAATGDAFWYDPRTVLTRTVEIVHAAGWRPVIAAELEFYLIDFQRGDGGAPQPVVSPRTGRTEGAGKVLSLAKLDEYQPVITAMEAACRAQNIPSSTIISEYGAGQFEINLEHRDDPIRAADDACLLRRVVQSVAREFGMEATFMSKPFPDQAGSGLHVHASMLDAKGRNVFDSRAKDGETMLGHAVAGLQATMAEAMAIFAPNINVFRRFKANNFTPVTRDWGENNRSVAFRVPVSTGAARRVEHRISGAEANPYLVIAAVIAGMHHGLENRLDPGEKFAGNAGAAVDEALPLTPWDSLRALRAATILPRWLGKDYPAIYASVKEAEFAALMDAVSPREYEWYL